MPDLTVQEARAKLRGLIYDLHTARIPERAFINAAMCPCGEGTQSFKTPLCDALRDLDVALAAHDAEGVSGDWVVVAPNAAWPSWGVEIPGRCGIESIPNEATARAYAKALNRADHSLKEGT